MKKHLSPSEGGASEHDVSVPPSPRAAAADAAYRKSKGLDGYINVVPILFRGYARTFLENLLMNTKSLSGRNVAVAFRDLSKDLAKNHGSEPTEMELKCNNKLWASNGRGDLNSLKSDDLVPMFAPGKQADWPNLVLTSNHARAGESKDLSELIEGIERIACDAGDKKLDFYRFSAEDKKQPKPIVANKTIVALACHTERDIFLNGAELIDRRCDLEEDKIGNADPKRRTLAHMSPAAMRLAKLMMKLMTEPGQNGKALVDLNRATDRNHIDAPFIANDHTKSLVLRADAATIAQHIKLVGYSKGANTVTDALRFLHMEYAALGERLKVRDRDGTLHPVTEKEMAGLIGNIGLLSMSPGEVPLTKAEKQAGIKRVTILNTNDLTAGHLVNPQAAHYDRWDDRLIKIEGGREESGHSIVDALGNATRQGFIMDPKNAHLPNYQTAQDEVRAFFASNHRRQAITTLCFSTEGPENALYAQFAVGVGKAQEKAVGRHVLQALHAGGFNKATVESDFARRRMRIVLDRNGADSPLVNEAGTVIQRGSATVERCAKVFSDLNHPEEGKPFVTRDVFDYLDGARR